MSTGYIAVLLQNSTHSSINIISVDEVLSPSTIKKRWAISLRAQGMEKTATVIIDADEATKFPFTEALNKIAVFNR